MEKDATAAHRRHRPGPGAPPSGAKASEAAELQRSRSVGGLLQKGDPPSCIKKLCRESESEDQGKDLKCDPEEVTSHADLKEHKWEESQHILGKADRESGTAEPEEQDPESPQLEDLLEEEDKPGSSSGLGKQCLGGQPFLAGRHPVWPSCAEPACDSAPSTRPPLPAQLPSSPMSGPVSGGPGGDGPGPRAHYPRKSPLAQLVHARQPCLFGFHSQKPSVFVEIDLGDHAEEVATCATREEKRSQMDVGDLSEDETRTSWVCCIPYSTRKKVKQSV
ncbi:uncharacterized protein C13orf46 homolog isoform X2 [Equus caballus]|uniref:uncharacterized protein C13orf46 homolog isoform X2 n=1 Tax=Equus caballus TaxID=9796 RepID=UPI0038B24488